ncbi:MAG: Exopolysaccharide synthesis ExoD [Verrucomicrobiales bacterium]|jgi:hypothetical protein|nr:Exopolysaccharide synthesis ExoD [Verrucomicrobiales bacterium]
MLHPPLSQSLAIVIERHETEHLTLNGLIERTEKRGLYLVFILLSLPFANPIPMPGLSNVLGFVILLLAIRLALKRRAVLPPFLGDRVLPKPQMELVLRNSIRILRWMEKFVRPRGTDWLTWSAAQFGNALLVAFMGFLLMLPFPPVVPFSNSLPAVSIVLLALSMMEEDGVLIWAGYISSLITTIYLASTTGLMIHFFTRILGAFFRWLSS